MGRLSKSAAVGSVALLIGGGAYALASSNGSTISVCVSHKGGTLYKARKCAKPDGKLSWNKQGPPGTTGAQGPKGDTGPQGPPGAPAVSFWAVVNADGTLARSSGTTGSQRLANGNYEVDFSAAVNSCAYTATVGGVTGGSVQGDADVAPRSGTPAGVFIETRDNSGTLADKSFHLMVAC